MSTLIVNTIKSLNEGAGNPLTIDDSLVSSGSSVTNDGVNAQSIAFGQDNSTTGVAAVSLAGTANTASSYAATLAGNGCHASAFNSVAMGSSTEALKQSSFAHGRDAIASASYSHAEGFSTITDSNYQHAQGKYNATGSGALMVIGNGTAENSRNNLVEFHTDSIILDTNSLPTSDPGVTGQLYTTGSDFFGGPSGKKVLMIS